MKCVVSLLYLYAIVEDEIVINLPKRWFNMKLDCFLFYKFNLIRVLVNYIVRRQMRIIAHINQKKLFQFYSHSEILVVIVF